MLLQSTVKSTVDTCHLHRFWLKDQFPLSQYNAESKIAMDLRKTGYPEFAFKFSIW